MTKTFQADLEKRLEDDKFAEKYGSSIAKAEIAVTVTQARRNKGITQQELADKIGKTQAYIAKLEGGDANPTVGNVGKILANMGVRLVTGINSLSSNIENKEASVLSLNANQTFSCFNSHYAFVNDRIGIASVSPSRMPQSSCGNITVNRVSDNLIVLLGTNNMAEDSTDVLWQAPSVESKSSVLDPKGGNR